MEAFIHIVNKVIECYDGKKLNKFRVAYPLDEDSNCDINNWIVFAIANGVSMFELNFIDINLSTRPNGYYLSADIFRGGKMMDRKHICNPLFIKSISVDKHYESVTEFRLTCVNLSDEVFEIMLSRCLSLEKFVLMNNYSLVNARNSNPHLKLRCLELYFCKDLENVEIVGPNLLSFKYQGVMANICIKDSQELLNLRLSTGIIRLEPTDFNYPGGKDFFIRQFASNLSKLESLTVQVNIFEDMSAFAKLPAFANLKQLVLDVMSSAEVPLGYVAVVSFMKAAPNLQQLELNLQRTKLGGYEKRARKLCSMSPHHNLKEFKLIGFLGDANCVKFVTNFLKHAVALQKIDITIGLAVRIGEDTFLNRQRLFNSRKAKRCEKSLQQLRETLPLNVRFSLHGQFALLLAGQIS